MKRILVPTSLSLTAMLAVTSVASAQIGPPIRAATERVTSNTTPTRERLRPYTFTTTGRVTPPPACAFGNLPTVPGGRCVPPVCPPGTDATPAYCVSPPRRQLCTGKITVRFKKEATPGAYTISTRTVSLRADCTYRTRVTFRRRTPLRRGRLKVLARFEGNFFLLPKNAPVRFVRAG